MHYTNLINMLTEQLFQNDHEQILFCQDKKLDFQAVIALHNTSLGPALGGIRYYPYLNLQEATADVLRLSRAMTFKSSIAGLNLGGGKTVILAQKSHDFPKILAKMGDFINGLGGQYYGAEDIGVDTSAIEQILTTTSFVTGKPLHAGGAGKPAPFTAYGVYLGMKAAVLHTLKTDTLQGLTILVEGVGGVGAALIPYLLKEKAEVYIDDIRIEQIQQLMTQYPLLKNYRDKKPKTISIYAPCAIGLVVNPQKIKILQPKIIAGGANNQLVSETYAQQLLDEKIVYVPDFLINSGGVINCAEEITSSVYDTQIVFKKIDYIYQKTLDILQQSEVLNQSTHQVAIQMAMNRLV